MNGQQDKSQKFWEEEILPRLRQSQKDGTLSELAVAIGCHTQALYKYLDGTRGKRVSFSQLKNVARALGFSESEIIQRCFDQTDKIAILNQKYPELIEKLYDALEFTEDREYIETILDMASSRKPK